MIVVAPTLQSCAPGVQDDSTHFIAMRSMSGQAAMVRVCDFVYLCYAG
jgi:hypothetical protein